MGDLKVGVAAVLWRNGRVLMMQRQGSHGAGTWAFIGGHLDEGESPKEAAAREVLEETGLRVPPGLFEATTFTSDVFKSEGKSYITLYFKADLDTGSRVEAEPEIREPTKASDMKWVRPGDWPGELFLPIQNLLNQQAGLKALERWTL